MRRRRWLCLGVIGVLVGGVAVGMVAGTGAATEPPAAVAGSLAELKASFYGMVLAGDVSSLEAEVTRNAGLIGPILAYADSSPQAREALSAHLLSDLDSFSSRFAPGTEIDEEILRPKAWVQGEQPWYGLTIDAYLLLEVASSAGSPAFTRQALLRAHDAHQALAYFFETKEQQAVAEGALPPPPPHQAGFPGYKPSGSTPGEELAWCCEQFVVEGYSSGAFSETREAQAVAADYLQWRRKTMAERGAERWLPIDFAADTMEWVGKLAAALPEAKGAAE